MNSKLLIALTVGCLSLSATKIYQQNFESVSFGAPPTGWSGAGAAVESTGGFSAFGFGAKHLFNGGTTASTLTLSGLLAHSTLTVNFDLVLWDSVDSGSDFMTIRADGIDIISATVNIGNYANTGPAGDGPGTPITPNFVDFSVQTMVRTRATATPPVASRSPSITPPRRLYFPGRIQTPKLLRMNPSAWTISR